MVITYFIIKRSKTSYLPSLKYTHESKRFSHECISKYKSMLVCVSIVQLDDGDPMYATQCNLTLNQLTP